MLGRDVFDRFRRAYNTEPAGDTRVGGRQVIGGGGGAVGLRGSSTIVGLHFQSVAATVMGFAASAPIAGKVQLEGVILSSDATALVEDPHRFQLAIASEVPGSQAALDAAEAIFPRASQATDSRFSFPVSPTYGSYWWPVSTVLSFNGRRFVAGFYNGHATAAMDAWVALVLHRVTGGEVSGDPSFLSGEEVEMR